MRKPVVVIGGMGPQASLRFHELLIEKSKKYHSGNGDEFPFIIHFSLPVEDFISNRVKEDEATRVLNDLTDTIERLQPAAITLACNTAHILQSRVRFMQRPEFSSMIEVVAKNIEARDISLVGLLASPTTIRTKLYEEALSKHNVKVRLPSDDKLPLVEAAIRTVISGKQNRSVQMELSALAGTLADDGAEAILLGCTELPLIFDKTDAKLPVFDCLDIYADAVIARYYLYNGN